MSTDDRIRLENIKFYEGRHYEEPVKTLEQCESHGRDHAAYKWSRQIDSRWTDEQKLRYIKGYEEQRG